jgi:ankyrin repeat protein
MSGDTALHLAVRNNSPTSALALLDFGADVNIRNDEGFTVAEATQVGRHHHHHSRSR